MQGGEKGTYSNLTVLAFFSTMERSIVAKFADIIGLIVPIMADSGQWVWLLTGPRLPGHRVWDCLPFKPLLLLWNGLH